MITPTVGRIVWYYPHGHKRGDQPLAAIVVHVLSGTFVNLAAFHADGVAFRADCVQLVQEGDEAPPDNYCTWMPYQIGQAKKTEEALAKANAKRDTLTQPERG